MSGLFDSKVHGYYHFKMRIFPSFTIALALFLINFIFDGSGKLPDNFKYGVNLGGWLLVEPWMNPDEWLEMGGENCPANRALCASSEWGLTNKIGQARANQVFLQHWKTWFNYTHANRIRELKLDHVRIPIGFWIIEEIVEAPREVYAQGGWSELRRGLKELRQAGLYVILDMHAMPGVSSINQMFAGNFTDDVQFYSDHNYRRALNWAAILTAMTHLDPAFENVVAIECINEPIPNPVFTPGLGKYYSDFVTVVRVIEYMLGVGCEVDLNDSIKRLAQSKNAIAALQDSIKLIPKYASKALKEENGSKINQGGLVDPRLKNLLEIFKPDGPIHFNKRNNDNYADLEIRSDISTKTCITTIAMSARWQSQAVDPDKRISLAPYILGPAIYDDHFYFAFGGVAQPNYESYIEVICEGDLSDKMKKYFNEDVLAHNEFSLATNFNATGDQVRHWGDAQRLIFGKKGAPWTFWSFQLGSGVSRKSLISWSYFDAVELGFWPTDPTYFFNSPNKICSNSSEPVG